MKKYNITKVIAITISAVFLAGLGILSNASGTLNIVSWGGAYTKSQNEAYHKPFAKKAKVKINNIDQGSAAPAGLRAQVKAGKVTWDLVDVLEADSARLCDDGIVERIDYNSILAPGNDGSKPTDDFVGGLNGCFIPQIVYATLFGYNSEVFQGKKVPKTIKDVFNLKKFPGKRAFEKVPGNNLEWALIADGVKVRNVYKVLSTEAGVNRAFKKLESIKNHIIWWEKGAQPPQLLADKEVVIASAYNGRLFNAQVIENQPIEIIWDAQSVEIDGWVVPKGKLSKQVKEYIYFATDSQRLADQAKYISYSPARKSSATLVSTLADDPSVEVGPHLPTHPDNYFNPLVKNAEFWIDNGESLNERFQAWLAK